MWCQVTMHFRIASLSSSWDGAAAVGNALNLIFCDVFDKSQRLVILAGAKLGRV